jgi:cytochrome b pre-mRNA-processing protein 3
MQQSRQSLPIAVRARRWIRRFWPDAADRARREFADRLYRALVKQARMPTFYRALGVPDTPEGRFEMVGLHVALVVRRLRVAGAPGAALGQELFDLMFADMDESLRQIGIGEMSVGKHIKRLAGNFYARLIVLDEALAASPEASLAQMLRTNAYHGGAAPSPHQIDALASYLLAAEAALRTQATEHLLAGQVHWVPPESPKRKTSSEDT